MSDEINHMTVKEFRELGYLQELNRRFLHPLGLALEVVVDSETKEESFGNVWDYRDDPEGIIYASGIIDAEKAARIYDEETNLEFTRLAKLGFVVQPEK